MELTPATELTAQSSSELPQYLRLTASHTSVEINPALVHAVRQSLELAVLFLYPDHEVDPGISPGLWSLDAIVQVESNAEVTEFEAIFEEAIALFPADFLGGEVLSEAEFRKFQSDLYGYQI